MAEIQQQPQSQKQENKLASTVTKLVGLYAENIRLNTTEKATMLLSGIAIVVVAISLTMIAAIFVAIGLADLLEEVVPPYVSYFIIAGVILVCVAVLIVFKDSLVVNPIARFLSRLILNPAKKQ